jgi:hypothetical protein
VPTRSRLGAVRARDARNVEGGVEIPYGNCTGLARLMLQALRTSAPSGAMEVLLCSLRWATSLKSRYGPLCRSIRSESLVD